MDSSTNNTSSALAVTDYVIGHICDNCTLTQDKFKLRFVNHIGANNWGIARGAPHLRLRWQLWHCHGFGGALQSQEGPKRKGRHGRRWGHGTLRMYSGRHMSIHITTFIYICIQNNYQLDMIFGSEHVAIYSQHLKMMGTWLSDAAPQDRTMGDFALNVHVWLPRAFLSMFFNGFFHEKCQT